MQSGGHHIDAIIRQEKRRIRDQILEMYIRNEVDRREAILFYPARGVTVMKREGFWRYATPPVNIQGRTSAVHHDLSVYMPLSLQNNLLDLHRHHFIFSLFSTVQAGLSGRSVLAFSAF